MPRRNSAPEIVFEVTEDHFERAVPGDQCHCTIGQAVHDALPTILSEMDFESVDANTISVNPADVNGEPAVGVSMRGKRSDGEEVNFRFVLQDSAAFKVAYTTDNRATGQMRKRAARTPYVLKATEVKVRKTRMAANGKVAPGTGGRPKFTPEGHIKALASYAVQDSSSETVALERVRQKLADKVAAKSLPYKLTAQLKRFAEDAVASSWENKGTKPHTTQRIRIRHNQRFYS